MTAISFNCFNRPLGLTRKLKVGSIHLAKATENTIYNLKIFYKARGKVITLFGDYTTVISKAKNKASYREVLKILTPKQMLQCLPIAFALVNASNTYENLLTSEKLLNEITEITYSLYQTK